MGKPLDESFFLCPVWEVAQALLGKVLIVRTAEGEAAVRITETEAYGGVTDRACHAYGGRRTPRNAPMYERGGTLYLYKCYGIHHMLNIVTGEEGDPCAVLVRAGEPLWGIPLMMKRRNAPLSRLTVGPGSLTKALAIPLTWSGHSALNHPFLRLEEDSFVPQRICCGARIGVEYAGEDALHPWRYWIEGSPFVSHPRRAAFVKPV